MTENLEFVSHLSQKQDSKFPTNADLRTNR
jgi:hypothetical protein